MKNKSAERPYVKRAKRYSIYSARSAGRSQDLRHPKVARRPAQSGRKAKTLTYSEKKPRGIQGVLTAAVMRSQAHRTAASDRRDDLPNF